MANFPNSLDTFASPVGSNTLSNPDHTVEHLLVSSAISALESKVGITSSADTASLDYLVKHAYFVASSSAPAWMVKQAQYVCDGTADDVQIQQAVDAANGGLVILSPGTFSVSSSIELDDSTSLMGAGINSTVLQLANNANTNVLRSPSAATGNVYFVTVKNLAIYGNKTNNSSGRGIYMKFAHTWLIEDVFIKDTAEHGVDIVATGTSNIALNNWFKNCRIQDTASGQYNIVFGSYAPNNHVLNCIFGSSTAQAAVGLLNDETTFIGCHISGAGTNGIKISGSNNIITGNFVEASTSDGIVVDDGVSGNRIENNVIFNSGYGGAAGTYSGIKVSGQKTAIIGNRMFDRQGTKTQDYGIYIDSTATGTMLRGNTADVADHVTGDIFIHASAVDNDLWEYDAWRRDTKTWTYASASTFTVAGDQTAQFRKGTKLRYIQSGSTKYHDVASATYATGTTTVTIIVNSDYTLANAAISSTFYSYEDAPQGYPTSLAYTPTFTGFSSSPTGPYRYSLRGGNAYVYAGDGVGTSNAGGMTFTGPVAAGSVASFTPVSVGRTNTGGTEGIGMARVSVNSATITCYPTIDGGSWGTAGNKLWSGQISYPL